MPLTWSIQRTRDTGSEMVLIHDDDLARIQRFHQPDALMDHLQSSKPEIREVLYGQYHLPILQLSRVLMPDLFTQKIVRPWMKAAIRMSLSW